MDWSGEQYQYGGGGGCSGCFLYCTLQRPCCDGGDGRNHSGGRHHVTGGDGSAPCVSPSVIGAIRTCRDIFDKLCTAADRQAGRPASCACRNPLPPPRYPRECCCCREPPPRYQPPRSVRFSDDDGTCTTCTTWVTTTDEEEKDENEDENQDEVVQKTEDKATATSEWTLHVQGGDAGADGEQSIATSDLTNERELEVISETDTPHEKHDYAAAGYAVEELEEEEVLHGGLLEPSVSGGYEIAFSEPEPFTTEQEQNETEQPAPKPPEEPDQSKATTAIKRVPCKHRKKKSKCCKCKNKNTQHRPADDKPRSLCQCAPIVIFDSPPPAKRNFFDFLKGLLPRPKRTGSKTSAGKDQKVLCACGQEMQPFFGYADLDKRGSRDKKVHGKLSKKSKAEAPSEEERLRPSKRVATQSDEIKIGTLEECRCAGADIKNTGAKSSRRSSKNKRQLEALNEAEVTTGSRRDSSRTSSDRSKSWKNQMSPHGSKHKQDGGRNRQGSHQSGERTSNCNCNLQEHWAKLKANGQQVPVKENASKTANRKSSLEQPLKPSGISSNSKKPTHVVDVDDCEGSLCNLQDHWAKLKEQQVPVKESHNKIGRRSSNSKKGTLVVDVDEHEGSLCNLQDDLAKLKEQQVPVKESHNKIGHKSSNSKKEMHVVDFDENEGSVCNLQEHWAKQAAAAQKKT